MTYSFNIMNWTLAQIEKVYTKAKKLKARNSMHPSRTDIDNF